jgi:hypothetical protein
MTQAIVNAELLDDGGHVIAHVKGSMWKREANGSLINWGGDLKPSSGLLRISTGAYILKLSDGKKAPIVVNNVRVQGSNGSRPVSAATFLGNGSPPA